MIARAAISSLILALALTPFAARAEKLVINSNESDPAPKETFTKVVDEFKKQNSDLQVEFNTMDHEGYKTAIRNWLTTEPPDVVFWFAGNRMKAFVDRGLLDDVSDLWQKNNYDQVFKSTLPAMTVMASSGVSPLPITSGASTTAKTYSTSTGFRCQRPGTNFLRRAKS